uniref:Uncharacterized protein n=1 Tax=Candidatus Kentrum sp. TUN TaxID=2126343 RepID=A0A450ZJ82_9GAMM|nr:MAG: hypothetical protein BECKTUN1418F_GA0071002_10299 [Candidatus Kentron sp. TUN]
MEIKAIRKQPIHISHPFIDLNLSALNKLAKLRLGPLTHDVALVWGDASLDIPTIGSDVKWLAKLLQFEAVINWKY